MNQFEQSPRQSDAPTINDSTGIGTPPVNAAWNPDAIIFAARGVKSLEELDEKYEYGELKPGCTVRHP